MCTIKMSGMFHTYPTCLLAALLVLVVLVTVLLVLVLILVVVLVLILLILVLILVHFLIPPLIFSRSRRVNSMSRFSAFIPCFKQNTCQKSCKNRSCNASGTGFQSAGKDA